jgi:hypothetical protein
LGIPDRRRTRPVAVLLAVLALPWPALGAWRVTGHRHVFDTIEVEVSTFWTSRREIVQVPCRHPEFRYFEEPAGPRTSVAAAGAAGSELVEGEAALLGVAPPAAGAAESESNDPVAVDTVQDPETVKVPRGRWTVAYHRHLSDTIEVDVKVLWVSQRTSVQIPCLHPVWQFEADP